MLITVSVGLPHLVLHPNGRTRVRGYLAKLVREARHEARIAALDTIGRRGKELGLPWPHARLDLVFCFKSARRLRHDDDNLIRWAKHSRDGLADAGIVADDRDLSVGSVSMCVGRQESLSLLVTRLEVQ